jgi:DNA-binding CsgD family transcriptional regulator
MQLNIPASPDLKECLTAYIDEGWWKTDHRASRTWPRADSGQTVILEHDIVSEDELQCLPVYHELYGRFDLPWWGALAVKIGDEKYGIPLLRSSKQGPYSEADRKLLSRLVRPLEKILSFASKLADTTASVSFRLLDRIDCAAFLVDGHGKVCRSNAKAEQLVGNGLIISHQVLVAADQSSNLALQELIHRAIAYPGLMLAGQDEPILLKRPNCDPLFVEAIPASSFLADAFPNTQVLLLVSDPSSQRAKFPEQLRRYFGLTKVEVILACWLADGNSIEDFAEQHNLTIGTARQRAKQILNKTGTHRQSQLVSLIKSYQAALNKIGR